MAGALPLESITRLDVRTTAVYTINNCS